MTGSDRVTYRSERNQVAQGGREHYDAIDESRGGVRGPFPVLLNSPEMAGLIGQLGHYLRFEGVLEDAARELVIIATARHFDCPYEWAAHAEIARDVGVDNATVEAIADEVDPDELEEPARTLVSYVWELLGDHTVSDETFGAAYEGYGERGVVEITGTVGYYSMIACTLNAFEVFPEKPFFA